MFRFHILRWLLWCNDNSVQLLVYMHFTAHNIVLQCLTCHFVFMPYPFPPSTLSAKYQFQKLLRYPSVFYTQTRCWRRQGLSKSFEGQVVLQFLLPMKQSYSVFCWNVLLPPPFQFLSPTTSDFSLFSFCYFPLLCFFLNTSALVASPTLSCCTECLTLLAIAS